MYKNTRVYAILIVISGLFSAFSASAQSGSVSKPTNEKKTLIKSKSSKSKEMEKEKRERKTTFNAAKNKAAQEGKTVVLPMQYLGVSEPLSTLAARPQPAIRKEDGMVQEDHPEPLLEEDSDNKPNNENVAPAVVQNETTEPLAAVLGASFEGPGTGLAGFSLTGAPPDTTMAVGPNHIVAWVNSQYAVFNKTGTLLLGPVNGSTLFTGVANVCGTTNRGDPILQYDRLANRWILSQFAFTSSSAAPWFQCIAVSTTNDPTGTYVRYSVDFSAVGFNDYGKLGIWNDAYYTAYNIFNAAGTNTGAALCASDRTKMLAGDPTATTLCAPNAFYAGGAAFLPADIDGTAPPTDTTRGGVFMRLRTGAPRALRIMRLKPDFTAGTVTLTDGFGGATGTFINLPVTVTLPCNDTGGTCVAQPGTTNTLDTLGSRLMYRLAYRNRGGVDSLVVTHSVDPDGAAARSSALAWYEVRNPLGNPADPTVSLRPFLNQNATFDPGATSDRWMGSIAMNKFGAMLMGYSIANSGTGLKPSIAVAGRHIDDALNTLQTETIAVTGTGSQNGTLTRWGDYSTMQVDPADDETFWYTTQYLAADGTFNWRTRIVSYRFNTTTAIADGDFNTPGNWNNGVPTAIKSGIIPTGRTITVSTPSTVGDLNVNAGGTLVMGANLSVSGVLTLGAKVDTGSNTLALACTASVAGASATNYIIGNLQKDFCATGAFTYPTGTANGYSPVNTNVTTLTTNPSSLLIKANQGNKPGMSTTNSLQRYWTLTKTAGNLTTDLVFNYNDPLDIVGTESGYLLYRFVGTTGTAVPFTLNTAANTISATGISTFSDWAGGVLAPTAAAVSVSGKVLSAQGSGLSRVSVSITDSTGQTRYAVTNNFGYYQFGDLTAGQNYVLEVRSKRYQFTNPSQIITLNDDLQELNFTALP